MGAGGYVPRGSTTHPRPLDNNCRSRDAQGTVGTWGRPHAYRRLDRGFIAPDSRVLHRSVARNIRKTVPIALLGGGKHLPAAFQASEELQEELLQAAARW